MFLVPFSEFRLDPSKSSIKCGILIDLIFPFSFNDVLWLPVYIPDSSMSEDVILGESTRVNMDENGIMIRRPVGVMSDSRVTKQLKPATISKGSIKPTHIDIEI